MKKKIAVVLRDRQEEGLRMAIGLTLMNDKVDVFVLDRKLEETEKNITNIEMAGAVNIDMYSNCSENNGMKHLSTEEIAITLLEYDHVLPY